MPTSLSTNAATKQQFETAWNKVANISTASPALTPDQLRDHSVVTPGNASPWAYIFKWLSFQNDVPYTLFETPNPFGSGDWPDYAKKQLFLACVLVVCGVIVFFGVLYYLIFNKPRPRKKVPPLRPLFCSSFLGFVILWVAAFMCVGRGFYAFNIIYKSISSLQPDLEMIRDKVGLLQPEFQNAAIWMQGWQNSCLGWDTMIKPALGEKVLKMNDEYQAKLLNISYVLYTLNEQISNLPEVVNDEKKQIRHIIKRDQNLIGCLVFLPTVLATIVIIFITTTVGYESKCHPRALRTVNWCVLECGSFPMGILILLVTLVSVAVAVLGTTMGSFCSNPEQNAINVMSAFQTGTRQGNYTTLVQYYLTGQPDTNPIVEKLRTVENIIKPLAANMFIITPALDVLGVLCGKVDKARVADVVANTAPAIEQILPLAKRDNVYRYYKEIVVEGLCGQFMGAIGWYLMCQVFAGMMLLPYIAKKAHEYIMELMDERQRQKEAAEAAEAEALLESLKAKPEKPKPWYAFCARQPKVAK